MENKAVNGLVLPRLYVILDASLIKQTLEQSELECAEKLVAAGVRLLQYRDKHADARELLEKARAIAERVCPQGVLFFVNDRPDIAAVAGASGVHVGQHDLSVEQSRAAMAQLSPAPLPAKLVGISTHNLEQFVAAAASTADYIALGPVFETRSKANPDPVVGTELIRRARRLTEKPIVAIGGITLELAPQIIGAGADSVAVISDVLLAPDPAARAEQFIEAVEKVRRPGNSTDTDVWLS
jgi:thiamine-phosphate pyrophosphorylase